MPPIGLSKDYNYLKWIYLVAVTPHILDILQFPIEILQKILMLTVCWLCVDYVLTMCWLCVDYGLTVGWSYGWDGCLPWSLPGPLPQQHIDWMPAIRPTGQTTGRPPEWPTNWATVWPTDRATSTLTRTHAHPRTHTHAHTPSDVTWQKGCFARWSQFKGIDEHQGYRRGSKY